MTERARRQRAPLRPEEIPMSVPAVARRRRAVAGAVAAVVRPAEAPAPLARRLEAHPKPAPGALPLHPSSALRAALRPGQLAAAGAWKAAAEAARPTSARQAEPARTQELPRSARRPAAVVAGHQRRGRHPRREPVRRQGWAATPERANPSSARFPGEPRQLGQQGSGRALRRAAPRSSQSLPDEKPVQSVVVRAGARAARSVPACVAYG
jgi:hypothetical protein